jgi:hypothetical protein
MGLHSKEHAHVRQRGMVHLLRGAFVHAGGCSPVPRAQNAPAARAVLSSDALTGGDAVDRAK